MIKAEMKYTIDDMKAFFKDYNRNKFITTMGFAYLIIGIILFIAARYLATLFDDPFLPLGLPYFIIIVFAIIVIFCLVKACRTTPEKMLKAINSTYKDSSTSYTFSENVFTAITSDGETRGESAIEYSKIPKALEGKEYFYIFANENSAYIIRKSAFAEGTPEELRNILKTELKDKFIIKKGVK